MAALSLRGSEAIRESSEGQAISDRQAGRFRTKFYKKASANKPRRKWLITFYKTIIMHLVDEYHLACASDVSWK
jgi:hypothetical protein